MAERPRIAEYVRFEIYIPTYYTIREPDPRTGDVVDLLRAVDQSLIDAFIEDTLSRFHGLTQSNPAGPAPYKGRWRRDVGSPVFVDYLTVVFGLVLFYPVHGVGDFL